MRGIQIVAIEQLLFVSVLICRASGCVADGENKGNNDNRKQSEKYPAPMADEVILDPGNHGREL